MQRVRGRAPAERVGSASRPPPLLRITHVLSMVQARATAAVMLLAVAQAAVAQAPRPQPTVTAAAATFSSLWGRDGELAASKLFDFSYAGQWRSWSGLNQFDWLLPPAPPHGRYQTNAASSPPPFIRLPPGQCPAAQPACHTLPAGP